MPRDLQVIEHLARIPNSHDKVFNEECLFSYDTPESPEGLFVCMEKFLGFGADHVMQYHKRTENPLYVRIKRKRIPKKVSDDDVVVVPEKVSKLAIGVPGGFQTEDKKFDFEETYSVVVLPEFEEFEIESKSVPENVRMSAKKIIKAESAEKRLRLAQLEGQWEGEMIQESKYADDLQQLDNGVKIPPGKWKCRDCDLTDNLWLNLTDGAVLCGRKFFDGSGGNNHALEYYNQNQYPLAVKLGTITPDGSADVYSYPEDNMVKDPKLKQHLAHFGIKMQEMSKTDKTMVELEIDLNQNREFSAITEAGSKLRPVFGKGLTGMANLGNTCYMNSVMQLLFTLPSFVDRYVKPSEQIFGKANLFDPLADFKLQICKLGTSLWSGKYSVQGQETTNGIKPLSFKSMIGKNHPSFSGYGQQDAQEFFLHLCNEMEKAHVGEQSPASCLQFQVEDRIEAQGTVKYLTRIEDYIPFPIPLEETCNKAEVAAFKAREEELKANGQKLGDEEPVRPIVKFEKCLQRFLVEEQVPDFTYPVTKEKTVALKSARLLTFPDYLLVQLKKFDVDENWVPYKLDVEVEMPDLLDLSALKKAKAGFQGGEVEMPKEDEPPAAPEIVADAGIVDQLSQMGFDINGCKKAAINTKNAGVEAAMNWVMEHMGDPDFAAPIPQATSKSSSNFVPNPEHMMNLMGMGLPEKKCMKALRETDNNVERAVDWIFSHPDDDGSDEPASAAAAAASGSSGGGVRANLTDGGSQYKLVGFISHIGKSTNVGHYVCHVLKDGQWIIFNDENVALSEKPPKSLGYLYLYERLK